MPARGRGSEGVPVSRGTEASPEPTCRQRGLARGRGALFPLYVDGRAGSTRVTAEPGASCVLDDCRAWTRGADEAHRPDPSHSPVGRVPVSRGTGGLEPAASEEPCSRAPARPSLHVGVGAGGTRSTIRPHVPLRARALAWPGRARRMTRATRRRPLLGAPSLFHVEQRQGAKLSASAEVCPWAPHLARGLSSMARVGAMRVATGAAVPPRVTPAGSVRAGLARHVGLTPRAVRGASPFHVERGRATPSSSADPGVEVRSGSGSVRRYG